MRWMHRPVLLSPGYQSKKKQKKESFPFFLFCFFCWLQWTLVDMQNDLNVKGVKAGVDVLFSYAVIGVFSAVIDVPGTWGCYQSGCLVMCFGQGGFLSGNNLCPTQYVCTGSATKRNKLCKDETLQIFPRNVSWKEVIYFLTVGDKMWLRCSAPKVQGERAQTQCIGHVLTPRIGHIKHIIVRRSAETRKVIGSPCRPASILLIIKRNQHLRLLMAATEFNCWD